MSTSHVRRILLIIGLALYASAIHTNVHPVVFGIAIGAGSYFITVALIPDR